MPTIEKPFILKIPATILSKGTYAWLPMVALYSQPPIISGLLAMYVLFSLGLLFIQQSTWQRLIQDDQLGTGEFLYTETFNPSARDIAVQVTASLVGGGLAWAILQGQLGLTGVQWFLLTGGYFLLEMVIHFFVFPPRYWVTDDGVWILSVQTSGFVWFGEVKAVEVLQDAELPRVATGLTTLTASRAVYLLPVKPEGFAEFDNEAVLYLHDIARFADFFSPNLVQGLDEVSDKA